MSSSAAVCLRSSEGKRCAGGLVLEADSTAKKLGGSQVLGGTIDSKRAVSHQLYYCGALSIAFSEKLLC